jgi:hypothetical protein
MSIDSKTTTQPDPINNTAFVKGPIGELCCVMFHDMAPAAPTDQQDPPPGA